MILQNTKSNLLIIYNAFLFHTGGTEGQRKVTYAEVQVK